MSEGEDGGFMSKKVAKKVAVSKTASAKKTAAKATAPAKKPTARV